MNREQILKILKVFIIATIFMLIFEIIFSIKEVNNFFSNAITKSNGVGVYVTLWIIMFLQVTIINVPAYTILSISVSINLDVFGWQFLLVVVSSYMCGCIFAYWLGRWFGVKAVKWCAGSEEDFEKWSGYLNSKGKLWYFLTILLPIFPDDLLCLVAGSTKFHFGKYCIYNFLGRAIGLVTMLGVLMLIGAMSSGFPFMIIVWALALTIEMVAHIIIKKKTTKTFDK